MFLIGVNGNYFAGREEDGNVKVTMWPSEAYMTEDENEAVEIANGIGGKVLYL